MKRLIVNADDFGFTRGVNAGIVRAFREGILTSTTLMANGDAWEETVELAKENPGLSVGCHLVLVGGKSVASRQQVPSLADDSGRLPFTLPAFLARLSSGKLRQQEIETELRAQITRIADAGITPTHLDSHKHTHAHPRVMAAVAKVAEEFRIRWLRKPFENAAGLLRGVGGRGVGTWKRRGLALAAATGEKKFRRLAETRGLRTPDHFWGIGATGSLNVEALLEMIEAMPEGTNELMCHPGLYDAELENSPTRLKQQREVELQALMEPRVRQAVEARGIRLCNFRELE